MATATCKVCRSVNHIDSLRCMNCGSALAVPRPPDGAELTELPPAPAMPPPNDGWAAIAAQNARAAQARPLTASAIVVTFLVVGLIVAFAVVVFFLPLHTPIAGVGGAEVTIASLLGPVLTSILVASFLFQLWMLIDVVISGADLGSKVLWVLLIVFLGLLGAIAYAVMGRSRRASRF